MLKAALMCGMALPTPRFTKRSVYQQCLLSLCPAYEKAQCGLKVWVKIPFPRNDRV
jgi:hypothetical protein